MPSSDQLERSQRSHSTAALATSFSPLSPSESATANVALAVADVGVQPDQHDSVSASPEDESLSSLPSQTVATIGTRPPGTLAQQGRSKSMTTFTPSSRTHYSSRGFEADPFEPNHVVTTTTTTTSDTSMYRSLSSFSSGALAAHEQGNWLERLGKRATTFGRWTTEHTSSDHTLGEAGSREMEGAPHDGDGTRRSPLLERRHGNNEDGDDSSDEEQGRKGLHISTSAANRDRPWGPTRNKSSLSVFHDPFENCEDHTLDFDYTSSRPTSPILSKPRSRPSSTPTSPINRMSRLEPLPHLSKGVSTRAQAEHDAELLGIDLDDPDVLTHQVLSAQDKLGVFSLVESVLEWPWSSSFDSKRSTQQKNRSKDPSFVDPRTSEPSTPTIKSLPISRVTSHHSLSHLFDDYYLSRQQNFSPSSASISTGNIIKAGDPSSTLMTTLKSSDSLVVSHHLEPIDVLNEGAWSETGELTAYYRAKSSGNLERLRWELEDPKLERYEVGKRLEKKVSSTGVRHGGPVDEDSEAEAEVGNRKGGMGGESFEGERTRMGIREGLGVLLDTIGLGSFV
ncbi:BQ5605_C021g09306 [Microbotryum silenes-dioicae]|uniref:BQ5605_C021g09306 protein n=1 Tax=Microbotryum silenes-dioicae TaxID=796604 RepID=A0A2X0PJY5_9BASI|nr:BQ5605_C021g09306 [Microbotryum silenes-dioicae]